MNIYIRKRIDDKLKDNNLKIILEYKEMNNEVKKIIKYISNYKKVLIGKIDKKLWKISYYQIILFYSKGRYNYCKTQKNEYIVKNRLYEIENLDEDFIRVSKKYIINVKHIKNVDINEIGKMIINMDNEEAIIVSRRNMKDVFSYLNKIII